MAAYYNENDPIAAEWLRRLILRGVIAPGVVDERSILEVRPDDLRGYRQCHFFAGIGVWSYALRLAGWSDDRPIWTGSCPCQPFSSAGKKRGHEDERHLWPAWFGLIRESDVVAVAGEQVADGDGKAWFDVVATDLEGRGYAVGAVSTLAAGFGSPNLRQRLYFVADRNGERRGLLARVEFEEHHALGRGGPGGMADAGGDRAREFAGVVPGDESEHEVRAARGDHAPIASGPVGELGDSSDARFARDRLQPLQREREGAGTHPRASGSGAVDGMVDAELARLEGLGGDGDRGDEPGRDEAGAAGPATAAGRAGPVNGFWGDAEWIACTDGKARPVEPGTFPLAHGAPARVGRLRAYGNALNAYQAAYFLAAYREVIDGH